MVAIVTVSLSRTLRGFNADMSGLTNIEKLKSMSDITSYFKPTFGKYLQGDEEVVFLFPGGWFSSGREDAFEIHQFVEKFMPKLVGETGLDATLVFGIDGRHVKGDIMADQIAVAVDETGILAAGRKFFPTRGERDHIRIDNWGDHGYLTGAWGNERMFQKYGKKWYMGVCYDSFGIRKKRISNPGAHAFLNLVHRFFPSGLGNSGEVYFARHGFAGASSTWQIPCFGAAVFYGREVPERWPTGVIANQHTQTWRYEDNLLRPVHHNQVSVEAGIASLGIYRI